MSGRKSAGNAAKRIVKDALFAAIALVIFVVEAQIPPLVPIPGVKLGLANIVTVWVLMRVGAKDAFGVMLTRVVIGGIFSGRIVFSLAGGLLSFLAVLILKRFITDRQIFVAGVVGAIFHNAGQLAAAVVIYRSPSVLVYAPVLVLSAVATGLLTGLTAQFLAQRLRVPGE